MKKRKGFTLTELMTVILIVAILASVSFSSLYSVIESVKANSVLKNSTMAIYHQIVNARYYSVENETSIFVSFNESDVQSSTSTDFDNAIYSYHVPNEISLSITDDSGNGASEEYEGVYFMDMLLKESDVAYERVKHATITLNYNAGNTDLSKKISIVNGLVRVIE